MDCLKNQILLSGFAQQLRCQNTDVPDNFFTLFDVAAVSPNVFRIKLPAPKERRLDFIQNRKFRRSKTFTHKVVLLMGLYAIK